jgi:hypothetical protein
MSKRPTKRPAASKRTPASKRATPIGGDLVARKGEAAPVRGGGDTLRFTWRIPPALHDRLRAWAYERRGTIADIVAEAVAEHLTANGR